MQKTSLLKPKYVQSDFKRLVVLEFCLLNLRNHEMLFWILYGIVNETSKCLSFNDIMCGCWDYNLRYIYTTLACIALYEQFLFEECGAYVPIAVLSYQKLIVPLGLIQK